MMTIFRKPFVSIDRLIGGGLAGLFLVLVANPLALGAQPATSGGGVLVEGKRKPDSKWKQYECETVESVLGRQAAGEQAPELSAYGGLLSKQYKATGYFYARKIGGRWWMIDPEGHPMLRMAMNAVYRKVFGGKIETLPADLAKHVQAEGGRLWASEAAEEFRELGINSLGRWSEYDVFLETGVRFPYTTSLSFMADFARKYDMTYAKYGHAGYLENCIPVFHPDFPAHCDEYAKEAVEDLRDDPYLVGHYTDNEMPAPRNLLDVSLALDPKHEILKYNYQAAWEWLRARHGSRAKAADATKKDNEDYLGFVYERYYRLTARALRKHDPNHLVLGSRLHGAGIKIESVVAAAGKHLDIISLNTYGLWNVSDELLEMWDEQANRPFIVSEFCIKGQDTGLPNDKGAGWIVKTQSDRGLWYQNFVIQLLRAKNCVGWDYFKYRDDPEVNKGVFTVEFERHDEFYDAVRKTHNSTYDLIERLDRRR